MKIITLLLILLQSSVGYAQVGIGTTTPDASAALDVESTDKGLLPPRMTEAERDAITSPAAGLIVWCTNCGSDGEVQVFNGTTWTNLIGGTAAEGPPQIGDYRDGGVVFYVAPQPTDLNGDGTLDTGLVCAIEDQSSGIQWYNGSFTTTGGDGISVGTGADNTAKIIASQGATQTDYAAGLAKAYTGGGYTDWFLPSKDELQKITYNISDIENTAISNGGNAFSNTKYWSSSETSTYKARYLDFADGSNGNPYKTQTLYVRAIRAF